MRELEIGKVYRHFKNKIYIVECIAFDTETQKELVVYRELYGEARRWVRDKESFLSEVGDRPKNDNITGQKYRFERVELQSK